VIEKTPHHLRYLPILHAIYPDAKVVMMQRDKDDCMKSFREAFGTGFGAQKMLPRSLADKLLQKELLLDIEIEKRAQRESWVLPVQFREFVADPERIVNEITSQI
jgi:hypothetical protein